MASEAGGLGFEWDPAKARANLAKHRVSFEEASTVFGDPLARTAYDRGHSQVEDRFATIGRSSDGRIIIVIHTDRGGCIRIISARPASPREAREHEQRGSGQPRR